MKRETTLSGFRRRLGWLPLFFLPWLPANAFQAPSSWTTVDFSGLRAHLSSLSQEEQTEQLRDWALMAAWMDSNPGDKTPGDTLFPLQPLRIDPLRPLNQKRVGALRWLTLADNAILALVPSDTKDPQRTLGRIADEYRVESDTAPRQVLVYAYRTNAERTELSIQKLPAVSGESLFTENAGYFEEDIRSAANLEKFLTRNLDLVLFRDAGDHIRLGGRAHSANLPRLVTLQDLAVLIKARIGLPAMVRAELQRRGLRETYESRVNEVIGEYLQKEASSLRTWTDFEALRKEAYAAVPYEKFLQNSVDAVLKENPPNIGFSLDPRTNYPQIAADLRSAAAGADSFYIKWLLPLETAELRREDAVEEDLFDEILRNMEEDSHAAAAARQIADKETGIASLLGLSGSEKGAAQANPEMPPARARTPGSNSAVTELEAREVVDAIRDASRAKSAELLRIADGLSKQDITPLLDLERYLQADIAGITIRPGAPRYRILDLQEMLKNNGADIKVDGIYGPATTALIKSFQEDQDLDQTGIVDVETWKALLESDPDKKQELDALHDLLQTLEQHRDYQCARYDGQFAGTEVGMTLFYTDLVMKLWSFANNNQKPMVPGFVPETEYEVSMIYKDDILHHPDTRGWLGGRSEALGFHRNGAETHLAPVATRLYNASSSFLFPGAEVPANFFAERFSSWWNNHYAEVADYEPQYHRLNQLMKWSAILGSLAERLPAPLSLLSSVSVPPPVRFDAWWARHKELKVSWDVKFLSLPAETTECMALIQSEPFRSLGGLYVMSGGVSTYTDEQIAARKAAEAGRATVEDSRLRALGIDFAKSNAAGPQKKLVGIDNSTITRAPDGVWSTTPAKEVRLDGDGSSIKSGTITSTFKAGTNGFTIESRTASGPVSSLTMDRTAAGIRLSGSEGPEFAAAVRLSSTAAADLKPGTLRTGWARIDLGDGRVAMRSVDSPGWVLVTPVKDPAAAPRGVRAAEAGKTVDIQAVDIADLEKLAAGRDWVSIQESGFLPGDIKAALAGGPPAEAKDVKLTIKGVSVSAKVDGEAIYLRRSGGSFDGSLGDLRTIASSFDDDDFNAVVQASGRGSVQFARRSAGGDVVLAGFGGDGGGGLPPPISTAFFDELIPPHGKYIKGILISDRQDTPLRVTEGLIELPANSSEEGRRQARRLADQVESKPQIGERIEKLASVGPGDLDFFEKQRENRAANYIEFKAVPSEKLGSIVLADLEFTADDPIVILRKGDVISTMAVPNGSAVSDARDYVDKAARGEAGDASVADLRDKARPYFELLDAVHQRAGANQLLTKEKGSVNAETVYRLGGGDPSVRFDRDIADVSASLGHLASRLTLDVAQSVVASTVVLNDPQYPVASAVAADLDALLVQVDAPVSYEQFMEEMEDPDLTQITLIARYRDGGLVFSDRWASLKEIAEDIADSFSPKKKDSLNVVTNGGQEVVDAFAESGRFSRVYLTRFTTGNQSSFEAALRKVATIFQAFALPVVEWSADDLKEAKEDFPEVSGLLDSASRTAGTSTTTDVSSLMKGGRDAGIDWSNDYSGGSLLKALRGKLRRKADADGDSVMKAVNEELLAPIADPATRKATATLQGLVQAKNE